MGLPSSRIICADVFDGLKQLEDESIHMVCTSPPYWSLRDYGVPGQLGLEKTPEEYIEKMVAVFREVRRVLRSDGTCWLNLGDSYAGSWGNYGDRRGQQRKRSTVKYERHAWDEFTQRPPTSHVSPGLKPKDLCMMPARVALSLQKDGWWLRSDIIWSKPNPMPESVRDRPTRAHEYVFLLTKAARYYYDADAIRVQQKEFIEYAAGPKASVIVGDSLSGGFAHKEGGFNATRQERGISYNPLGRNRRTVWEIPTQAYPDAHFATFPEALVRPCILAGTSAKGCCPECGKGRERITERDRQPTRPGQDNVLDDTGKANRDPQRHVTEIKTLGWRPGCECECIYEGNRTGQPWTPLQPCTVLDPFCGSGTTGLVALKLKRSFIGIELNPEYVKLAEDRIAKAETGVPAQELKAGQGALFGDKP